MPLITREMTLALPIMNSQTMGRRDTRVVSRLNEGLVHDMTPHYNMLPIAILGCFFGQVVPPVEGGRIQQVDQKILLVPPLRLDEELQYSVIFPCAIEKQGSLIWPIKHPVSLINVYFYSEDASLPQTWNISLNKQKNMEGTVITPHKLDDQRLDVQVSDPPLGSELSFSWET